MFLLDPFIGSGLAGLLFLIVGGVTYGVRGIFDVWSIVPLVLALAGLGVYLSKHYEDVKQALVSRKARFGANSVVLSLGVLAIVVFAQAIISNHNKSWDITKNQTNSLSDEAQKVAKGLDKEVTLYAFFAENGREEYESLLKKLHDLNPSKIKFEFINPTKRPLLAQQYSVKTYGSTAVVCGNSQELITTSREEDLVNAIVKVTSGAAKTVYFLKGHQELPIEEGQERSASEFKRALENSHFTVKDVNLVQSQKVPEDCSVLVMAGPLVDYPEPEIDVVRQYLARGGRMLAMVDPRRSLKNVIKLLNEAGAQPGNDIVVDPLLRLFGQDPIAPIVGTFDANHPIVKNMQLQVLMPMARTVDLASKMPEGAQGTVLAKSNPTAWAYTGTSNQIPGKPGPGDKRGPLAMAVAIEAEPKVFGAAGSSATAKAELVVYGTSTMFSNQALGIYNNQDLGINSVRWMAQDESHISIKPKDAENIPIIVPQTRMNFIWLLCLVLLPGVVLVTGIVVGVRRSREA